jgi:hypothetical protein
MIRSCPFKDSTISHVGFILLALTINSVESIQAFVFYLMQYSLSNVNIFFIIILIGYSLVYYIKAESDPSKVSVGYGRDEKMEIENSPAEGHRKSLSWVKWPNFGDLLKLLIPSGIRKDTSGWTNYSGMVISQKMIEREMDNRGSKSVASSTVKEQRVDGHWYGFNLPYLRCTLTGFERSYQIKILSNQIQIRSYTSLADEEHSSSVDLNSSLFLLSRAGLGFLQDFLMVSLILLWE